MDVTTYQLFKDFSGPVATVIASATAAAITWTFASRQVEVARRQADIAAGNSQIALDQLGHNLFERRYKIYEQTQELLRMLINRHHDKNVSPFELAPYNVTIKEARFFFSKSTCDWLDIIWSVDMPRYLELRLDPGSQGFLEATQRLVDRFEEAPEIFRKELEFTQFTRPQTL